MGKLLVINSADFSQNALGTVSISGELFPLVASAYGWVFHKSDDTTYNYGFQYNASLTFDKTRPIRVFVFDVSLYYGKTLSIFRDIPSPVGVNGYYGGFIKELPVGITPDTLRTQMPITSGSMNFRTTENGIKISTESSSQIGVTQTVKVPYWYKYLVITVPYKGSWTCKCQVVVNN